MIEIRKQEGSVSSIDLIVDGHTMHSTWSTASLNTAGLPPHYGIYIEDEPKLEPVINFSAVFSAS